MPPSYYTSENSARRATLGQRTRLAMGELEATVMDLLWEQGGWLTPGEVHRLVGRQPPLAYTTVMTILVRLWQKGRLERQRDGRAFAYKPRQSKAEYAASRMGEVLVGVEDRSSTLSHFLAGLQPGDRAQLRRLLKSRSEA